MPKENSEIKAKVNKKALETYKISKIPDITVLIIILMKVSMRKLERNLRLKI